MGPDQNMGPGGLATPGMGGCLRALPQQYDALLAFRADGEVVWSTDGAPLAHPVSCYRLCVSNKFSHFRQKTRICHLFNIWRRSLQPRKSADRTNPYVPRPGARNVARPPHPTHRTTSVRALPSDDATSCFAASKLTGVFCNKTAVRAREGWEGGGQR